MVSLKRFHIERCPRSTPKQLWILNYDNNHKNDACIMPRPKEPGAPRSEVQREIRSWTRSRSYFPRVWADVKPANWLINKKYLTSVKEEDILSASDVKILWQGWKMLHRASYQFSHWLESTWPDLTCAKVKFDIRTHVSENRLLVMSIEMFNAYRFLTVFLARPHIG